MNAENVKVINRVGLHFYCLAMKRDQTNDECVDCYLKSKIYKQGLTREACRRQNERRDH